MTVRNLLSILFIFTIIIACQTNTKNRSKDKNDKFPVDIDFENQFDNFREINLSQIADSIEYIKLENIPAAFVQNPWNIILSDSFIFVGQFNSVLKFDRKGKFICQIGKQGRGPEEYAQCYGIRINRKEELIYVNAGSSKKIIVYDYNGKFIRNLHFSLSMDFEIIDSNHIATPIYNYRGQAKYKLLVTNSVGDTINSLLNTVKFSVPKTEYISFGNFTRKFYRQNKQLHYIPQYGDTVFQIQSPKSIQAKYVIHKGKYKLPADCRMEAIPDHKKYQAKSEKYLFTIPIETLKYLFISYHSANGKGDKKLAIFDKETTEMYSIGKPSEKLYGFTNDLDGTGNYIHRLIQDDQYMISYHSSIKFLEKHEELIQQTEDNKVPENINPKFIEFVKSIKEDDNYIIQITHLKKNI